MPPISRSKRWAAAEVLFHSDMNLYISDPIDDISGDNGIPEFRGLLRVLPGSRGDRSMLITNILTATPTGGSRGEIRVSRIGGQVRYWYRTSVGWETMETNTRVVTYETLDANGDVGTTAGTFAIGDHSH